MFRNAFRVQTSLIIAFAIFGLALQSSAADKPKPGGLSFPRTLPSGIDIGVTTEQALRSAVGSAVGDKEELEPNDEISRGPAAKVYPKVAPATVLVHCGDSHGTGWIFDKSGLVVTNQHVVSSPLIELSTGYQFARIYLGRLEDGLMTLDEKPLHAYVYRVDHTQDLAMLQIVDLPEGKELPVVKLASKSPLPGTDCVAIGHPTRGTLWTVRSGEVAGIGDWPKDAIDSISRSVALTGDAKTQYAASLNSARPRKIVVSTCGINPGDSGGPLLNEDGELIGVTQSIPKGGTDKGISLDKFAYHVHLNEVKEFLALGLPKKPMLFIPSVFPQARTSRLSDRDENGKVDTWSFTVDQKSATGFFIDIDEDTAENFVKDFKNNRKSQSKFNPEFAFHFGGEPKTFYDTDNDGVWDLILIDANNDRKSDLSLRLVGKKFTRVELPNQSLYDPTLFEDEALTKRLIELMTDKDKKKEQDSK